MAEEEFTVPLGMDVKLMPVRCVDCHQDVPFGWIDMVGAPQCPANNGWGHRIPTTQFDAMKALAEQHKEES